MRKRCARERGRERAAACRRRKKNRYIKKYYTLHIFRGERRNGRGRGGGGVGVGGD